MRSLFLAILILSCASGGLLAGTASFDMETGRPMVELTVNGKGPFPFVLDTGCPGLLVMRSLAEELGLEIVGSEELNSPIGGTAVETDVVRVDSIELAGASVTGLEAAVLEMDGMGLGKGVAGPSLFREHGPMTIDFAGNKVVIGAAAPPAGIESWLTVGEAYLEATVAVGGVTMDGHVDSGSPGVLSVPSDFEQRLALSGPVQTVGTARTVDAEFEIRAAPIEGSARVGDAEIPLSRVQFGRFPVANLGSGGLRGLQLYIDWQHDRFALVGTAAPVAPQRQHRRVAGGEGSPGRAAAPGGGGPQVRRVAGPGDGPRFGIQGRPVAGGGIEVFGTEPGSPAEAMGLLEGDRIVAVNGKPMAELEFAQVRTELAMAQLELQVERDGETVQLTRGE